MIVTDAVIHEHDKEKEFFSHVWNHSVDAFQAGFDARRPLSDQEVGALQKLVAALKDGKDDLAMADEIRAAVFASGQNFFGLLLQLVGLTRNKILQDIKAAHPDSRALLRLSNHKSLIVHEPTWRIAGPYLASRFRKVFGLLALELPGNGAFEAVNQATWPGFIRQERAKRSGHEAEYRAAVLLKQCGFVFEPEEKANNPLCPDIQLYRISFDLIAPSKENPLVCIKATVHTANIGQFGASKDHLEMAEARRMIDAHFNAPRPLLVALIDGIGFESNAAGLRGVLEKSDEFCQFRTLWKLPVILSARLGENFRLYLPESEALYHAAFLSRYAKNGEICVIDDNLPPNSIAAGEGYFLLG